MRISVITVGTKMPQWVSDGVQEYDKRLPRELKLHWREIPLARQAANLSVAQRVVGEGERLLKAVEPSDLVIALEVTGKQVTTEQLAQQLQAWQMDGDNVSLLIGGPDGLSPGCLERADARWSLGKLTLPHPIVRVVLAEQLYRAWTITVNHPYHRQ